MAMVVVDDSSVQEESQLARWLGLRVGGHMALFYIRHMNRVNSRNDLVVDSTNNKYRRGYYYYYYLYIM